ncbi:hypothetical protein [Streptomyces sp. YPW6]|uniref:hypothetical protein n=1 Tax=Streptomyces sp. YPW6 TaxID=2840373 RepID=UPI003EC11D91
MVLAPALTVRTSAVMVVVPALSVRAPAVTLQFRTSGAALLVEALAAWARTLKAQVRA